MGPIILSLCREGVPILEGPLSEVPLYLANLPVCDDVIVWSVQVPRSLWNASRRSYTLSHCYFKAAKLCTDMSEADEKLSDAVEVYIYTVYSLYSCGPSSRALATLSTILFNLLRT